MKLRTAIGAGVLAVASLAPITSAAATPGNRWSAPTVSTGLVYGKAMCRDGTTHTAVGTGPFYATVYAGSVVQAHAKCLQLVTGGVSNYRFAYWVYLPR